MLGDGRLGGAVPRGGEAAGLPVNRLVDSDCTYVVLRTPPRGFNNSIFLKKYKERTCAKCGCVPPAPAFLRGCCAAQK